MAATQASPASSPCLLLRHTLATLAYRGGKAVRNAPPGFESFRAAEGSRSAGEILAHIGDLFDWAVSMIQGKQAWHSSTPLPWDQEVARFFTALDAFDQALDQTAELPVSLEVLFQGPVADALTHIGQISLLRRLASAPVKAENYAQAEITTGRVGPDQVPPRREF
jgi:hypothetical protein